MRIFLFVFVSVFAFGDMGYASDRSESENQLPPAAGSGDRAVRSWKSNAKTPEQARGLYKYQSMESKRVAREKAAAENADDVQQKIHIESQVADYKQREKERQQAQASSSENKPRLGFKKKPLTDAEKDLIHSQFPGHADQFTD